MKGFKDFIMRGNLVEIAVAFIIAGAFGTVVTAFTAVVLEAIAKAGGAPNFDEWAPGGFTTVGPFLTALIAFGIALIYRANRVVSFAQGDLGAIPASLAVLLIVSPRWPFLLALLAALVVAVALGALVEFLIIRRFNKAPRLLLTVATIGLAQVLAAIGLGLPQLFNLNVPPQKYASPFDVSGIDQSVVLVPPAAIRRYIDPSGAR